MEGDLKKGLETCEVTPHFAYWDVYWGELLRDEDPRFPTIVYGYETCSNANRARRGKHVHIPAVGACYGYVQTGEVEYADASSCRSAVLTGEMYFSTANGAVVRLGDSSRLVLLQAIGFLGQNLSGGPIEKRGRLKYIDRCSDSLLIAPPILGDPCLNHLHFPSGIEQTEHTHPSTRAGLIARGDGSCITPSGCYSLHPGRVFHIPRNGMHRFKTGSEGTMDVIAYHPDSDFGPTHEIHPMVNRTLVDGRKVDNTTGVHTQAGVVVGKRGVHVPPEFRPQGYDQ